MKARYLARVCPLESCITRRERPTCWFTVGYHQSEGWMRAFPGTSADSWADSRWSKAGVESKVVGFLIGEGQRKEGDKTQLFRAPSAPKLCLPLIYSLSARKVPVLSSDTVIRDADDRTIFILKITGLLTLDSPWSSEPPQPSSAVTEKLSL